MLLRLLPSPELNVGLTEPLCGFLSATSGRCSLPRVGEFARNGSELNVGVTNRMPVFSLPQVGEFLCHEWASLLALCDYNRTEELCGRCSHDPGIRWIPRPKSALELNAARVYGRRRCGHPIRAIVSLKWLIDLCSLCPDALHQKSAIDHRIT